MVVLVFFDDFTAGLEEAGSGAGLEAEAEAEAGGLGI
jgi:hypothetical protein